MYIYIRGCTVQIVHIMHSDQTRAAVIHIKTSSFTSADDVDYQRNVFNAEV